MDTMTTTQHLGQVPGRARRASAVACSSWRQHTSAPATDGPDATGVAEFQIDAYLGNTTPVDAMNVSFNKRHALHLARGST